jgi:hypothetical protein
MSDQGYRTAPINPLPMPVSTFSYYGSKSKVSGRYPAPRHGLIIEPFGGSAAYAWRHHVGRDVWVNELDDVTFAMWRFLQSAEAADVLRSLPSEIRKGQTIAEVIPDGAHPGLAGLIRAELSRGTAGRRDIPSRATAFGAYYYWPRLAPKFLIVAARVAGWKITNFDYIDIPNLTATWFIDPPYNNPAGRRYRQSDLDYSVLADWARERNGQVMVCENAGATWLPFLPLTPGRIGRQTQTTNTGEVLWERLESPERGDVDGGHPEQQQAIEPGND